jgi:hypothetical protein
MQAPNKIETQTLPPPPGIIGSLRAGFDVTTGHITAILMPAALDVLLWLGPRIGFYAAGQRFLKMLKAYPVPTAVQQSGDFAARMDQLQKVFKNGNFLTFLRTFPIGLSSLLSGQIPGASPLGKVAILQVDSFVKLAGLYLLITLIGWIIGAFYFRWVASLVTPEAAPSVSRAILQTLLYSVIWVALCWAIGIPVFTFLAVINIINPVIGQIALIVLAFLSMWLIVPVFFSVHGIFVKKQNAFASIVGSFQLARFTLPTSSLFILLVFVLAFGSNILWSQPATNSWLMGVGILGHAFITTALLASTFVYYQNMTAWLETILARLRNGYPPKAQA